MRTKCFFGFPHAIFKITPGLNKVVPDEERRLRSEGTYRKWPTWRMEMLGLHSRSSRPKANTLVAFLKFLSVVQQILLFEYLLSMEKKTSSMQKKREKRESSKSYSSSFSVDGLCLGSVHIIHVFTTLWEGILPLPPVRGTSADLGAPSHCCCCF